MSLTDDARRFRSLFSHFPTGVAVVTTMSETGPLGLTANAVCSLSLDPLLVVVCFDNSARTLPFIQDHSRFGLNMLRADQGALSRIFASKIPEHEKFNDVPYRLEDDLPVIDGALAWMTCDLRDLHPGGDHVIGVGEVREMAEDASGDPLVWYRGDYRGIV